MSKTAGRVRTETGRKRVRAYLGGELVADTRAPVLVWEWPYFPAYYFPAADVLAKLIPAGETEHSPSRGTRRSTTCGCPAPSRSGLPGATPPRRWKTSATWSGWTGTR